MQTYRRFLPLAVMALTAFSVTASLRAQSVDDLNAPRLLDLNSILQADSVRSRSVRNPFAKLFARQAKDPSAAGSYPGSSPSSSSSSNWAPTHFEIQGIAQWRNLNQDFNLSAICAGNTAQCTAGTGFNLKNDLGLAGQTAGPLFRFLWTPEKQIWGAKSLLRVEYGQITRTKTTTASRDLNFEGQIYPAGAAIQTKVQNKIFEVAYAPLWGNDKFRIGPMFTAGDLTVNLRLAGNTIGSAAPVSIAANSANFIATLGFDFEYTPMKQIDVYGHFGAIPCCGAGWTGTQSEFGVKYYLARSFSIMGGVRQGHLTRSFTAGPYTVNSVTTGTVNGSIKWSGVGPFIGASWRF